MDPNIIGDFMKNPEMMNMAMNMLKNNPGMMENIMKMKMPTGSNQSDTGTNQFDTGSNQSDTKFKPNEQVEIRELNNNEYNGQTGVIKGYHKEKKRYEVYITNMEKSIYLKEINIVIIKNE